MTRLKFFSAGTFFPDVTFTLSEVPPPPGPPLPRHRGLVLECIYLASSRSPPADPPPTRSFTPPQRFTRSADCVAFAATPSPTGCLVTLWFEFPSTAYLWDWNEPSLATSRVKLLTSFHHRRFPVFVWPPSVMSQSRLFFLL